ncbi:MAG TPA: SRPBCC domain-containing protein [Nocardioidaceae bacterium]|nr:SRPBCC domain-containing protein [Nocardioidaceae bacterium]
MTGYVATAEVDVSASPGQVWNALTDPVLIEQYMFGSHVETSWQPGDPIAWKGEYDGRAYVDHGEIIAVEPERRLEVTHFSPLTGQEDKPENYHRLVYEIDDRGDLVHVSLKQDNNGSEDEADHSAKNWQSMLDGLKEVVERG